MRDQSEQCQVDPCGNAVYSRGLCCAHYKRQLKARPSGTARPRPGAAAEDSTTSAMTPLPELLAALAAAVPPLPGARCRNRWELFDQTVTGPRGDHDVLPYARAAALQLCNQCPALNGCRAWLDGLPAHERPLGVVAGRVTT